MRVLILTNILNPYRKAFFDEMNRQLESAGGSLRVLVMSRTEYDRQWKYEEYATDYSVLLKCWSFRVRNLPFYFNKDLEQRIAEFKPDVLVMDGGYMLPSNWKCLKLQKKYGYKLHFWSESHLSQQNSYHSLTKFVREMIRKSFYQKVDGFWYPGEKALAFVKKYCKANAELYQLPNLIEYRKFLFPDDITEEERKKQRDTVREKYGIDKEKRMWFAPMRLHWHKGLIPFMELFAKVDGYQDVQLVVAGEGTKEAKEEIRSKAKELDVNLNLVGYHGEEETIKLYHAADAFFLPSVSDPSPLTCIEALWCGLPLLVSEYVGNAPEVVEHGENGYVFSFENQSCGAEMIREFMNRDVDWMSKASSKSLELAKERFGLENVTSRLLHEISNEDE